MKLFRFNKKTKEQNFRITEPDRNWVKENFKWLIQAYGYPARQSEQMTISEKYFPKTFSSSDLKIQNVIEDLSTFLALDSSKIKFQMHEDMRDVYGMPFASEGKPFEAEMEIVLHNSYKLHIAKSISKRPNRLIFSLIYEFIKIRLKESNLDYGDGEDTNLFLYLAGIYFGLGVPIGQNLIDQGRESDGFWETKWNTISEMPNEVMAFGLATYSKLIEQENPTWKNELPQVLRDQFDAAIQLLKKSPLGLYNKAELEASDLLHLADKQFENAEFESAISNLQKILFLTKDDLLKADACNNMGYCHLKRGDYEKSIPNFQKALQFAPDYGFAFDNLGYAYIQIGNLEEGKRNLDKAIKTENNDMAYTYRNLALYHLARGEIEKTKVNFQLAFKAETVPVDFLELHYANFLFDQGEREKGMGYMKKAAEKGEAEAIKRLSELKKGL